MLLAESDDPVVVAERALNGASVSEAFSVRCDRTTMTQNDLDNGRLIALVTLTAASTIETISVEASHGDRQRHQRTTDHG